MKTSFSCKEMDSELSWPNLAVLFFRNQTKSILHDSEGRKLYLLTLNSTLRLLKSYAYHTVDEYFM